MANAMKTPDCMSRPNRIGKRGVADVAGLGERGTRDLEDVVDEARDHDAANELSMIVDDHLVGAGERLEGARDEALEGSRRGRRR